jgi:hypothetical protein
MIIGRENQKCSTKNLLYCCSVHHKPLIDYLENEPRPPS